MNTNLITVHRKGAKSAETKKFLLPVRSRQEKSFAALSLRSLELCSDLLLRASLIVTHLGAQERIGDVGAGFMPARMAA